MFSQQILRRKFVNYEPRLVATILSNRGLLYLPKKGNDMIISIRVPADNNKHYRLYHLSARSIEAKEEKEISDSKNSL